LRWDRLVSLHDLYDVHSLPDLLEERLYLGLRRDRLVGLLDDILFPDILEERLYLDSRRDGLVGLLHDLHFQTTLLRTSPGLEAGQAGWSSG
jgi:hypothetical protein